MCINTLVEDLDAFCVALDRDKDDAKPDHDQDTFARVDGEDREDTSNKDCDPPTFHPPSEAYVWTMFCLCSF